MICMPYYAVASGIKPGIYSTWDECKNQVNGFKGAKYKKFDSKKEAETYIQQYSTMSFHEKSDILSSDRNLSSPEYFVYTDGACKNNGKPTATAGIGVFFSEVDTRNVSLALDSTAYKQTNNVAELCAILHAIKIIENDLIQSKCICIASDSEYAIKCATSYGHSCADSGWKKEIPNKELVKELFEYVNKYQTLIFMHIPAHTNNTDIHSIGNMNADMLANKSIGLNECPYSNDTKTMLFDVEASISDIHAKIVNILNKL